MPEDFFRPRVQPARGPAPTPAEPWPDQDGPPEPDHRQWGDAEAEPGREAEPGSTAGPDPIQVEPEDLLSPFDVIRRTLDARRDAEKWVGVLGGDDDTGDDDDGSGGDGDGAGDNGPVALITTAATLKPVVRATPKPVPLVPTSMLGVPPDLAAAPPADRTETRRTSRGQRIAVVGVVGVLALGAGAVIVLGGNGHSSAKAVSVLSPSAQAASAAPTPAAVHAVSWVTDSVGSAHVVACDASVCALLRASGFPPSSLVVATSLGQVEQADTVVLTGVLRAQLGSATNAIVAPEPLAVFGSGAGRVEVAAVALSGTETYLQTLTSDRASRRAAGTALLANPHLTMDSTAQALLTNGLVDTRVCALLALLAGSHTVTLAGFTPIASGAGPDVPSAGVAIESIDGKAATGSSASATGLLSTIQAQQDPYLPMTTTAGDLGGHRALLVVYSQPGPLDLLAGSTP